MEHNGNQFVTPGLEMFEGAAADIFLTGLTIQTLQSSMAHGNPHIEAGWVLPKVTNGITIVDMELMSVKLPPALRAKVAAEAQRRNVSQSTIVRESLERVLSGPTSRSEASCMDLAGSLVGSLRSGRRDLSTNKKLLADAMVSNAHDGRKRHH